jgi:hypothetical protein
MPALPMLSEMNQGSEIFRVGGIDGAALRRVALSREAFSQLLRFRRIATTQCDVKTFPGEP